MTQLQQQSKEQHAPVLTCAQIHVDWFCSNITGDVSSNQFLPVCGKGILRLAIGGPPSWVELGKSLSAAVLTAAVSPDGSKLYVDTPEDGLWEVNLAGAPGSKFRVVKPDEQGLGKVKSNKWMPQGMLCTGSLLYFWRVKGERLHLYSMQRSNRQVQLAYLGGKAETDKYPTWSLNASTGVLYFKPDSRQSNVLCIELREGLVTQQPSATLQLPGEMEGKSHLSSCAAGDGSLLVCALNQRKVYRYFPPSITSIEGGSGQLQLLAGGGEGCPDSAGDEPCKLYGPQTVVLDAKGHAWLYDSDGKQRKTVRCIFTQINPPSHLAGAPPLSGHTAQWMVGAQATSRGSNSCSSLTCLGSDLGQLLASGDKADVVLVAAGGERLHAHSQVLYARCEWFRRRAASGMQEAAGAGADAGSSGAGQQQQQGLDEVHVEEHPAAVVRALLCFLYSGTAQLWVSDDGPGAEGSNERAATDGSVSERQSKRQRVGSGAGQQEGEGDAAADAPEPPYLLLAQLLHAASVFQVPQLHAACLEVARAQLDVHCALPWLVYGHEHGEAELKQLALGYTAAHYADIKAAQPAAVEGLAQVEGRLVLELMHARDALK